MAKQAPEVTSTEVTAYSVAQAAKLLSIGRSSLYRELQTGNIASVKFRKRRLIPAVALRDWLARAQAA
jgi:excisionase family DNA binding protein